MAARTGASAFLIRDKLGHANVSMTARYVNRDASPLQVLSDRIEAEIGGALTGEKSKNG